MNTRTTSITPGASCYFISCGGYIDLNKLLSVDGSIANHRNVHVSLTSTENKWRVIERTSGRYSIVCDSNPTFGLNYYWTNGLGNSGNCDVYPYAGNEDSFVEFIPIENTFNHNVDEPTFCIKLSRANTDLYLTISSTEGDANVSWEPYIESSMRQAWVYHILPDDSGDDDTTSTTSFCWPTESTTITQYYNPTDDHYGIDVAPLTYDTVGDKIYAIADGVVERILNWSEGDPTTGNGSMGICMFIKHDNTVSSSGKYLRSIYMHLDSINNLSVNDPVSKGEIIGYMGHTGYCYSSTGGNGTHLHFSLKENSAPFTNIDYNFGTFVDPLNYSYE